MAVLRIWKLLNKINPDYIQNVIALAGLLTYFILNRPSRYKISGKNDSELVEVYSYGYSFRFSLNSLLILVHIPRNQKQGEGNKFSLWCVLRTV